MSQTSANAFIERLKFDDDFLSQVVSCRDARSRMDFVREEGYDFSSDELAILRGTFTDDDLSRTRFQESRLGYDGPDGHGQDPKPKKVPSHSSLN